MRLCNICSAVLSTAVVPLLNLFFERFSHNDSAVPFGALIKPALFIHRQWPSEIMACLIEFFELFIDISLDKIKTVSGCVFANAFGQLCGDALPLHVRRDHKAEDGFHFYVRTVISDRPKIAQIIDTEPTIPGGVAPSHDFMAVIGEIALNAAAFRYRRCARSRNSI